MIGETTWTSLAFVSCAQSLLRELVSLVEHPRTWNFFHGELVHARSDPLSDVTTGKGQLTTEEFPFDLDTTSLGLTVLKRDKEVAFSVMDEMLEYVDTDGIIQVCLLLSGLGHP